MQRAKAFRQRNRKCEKAATLKSPGFACGTCVAIAGLQRKPELMKKILSASIDLLPFAWVAIDEILPSDSLERQVLLERHKTLERIAFTYLKNGSNENFEDCPHFQAKFLQKNQEGSAYVIFALEQLFFGNDHLSELKILLEFSNFNPRKSHDSCMPRATTEDALLKTLNECIEKPRPISLPYQVFGHNLLEKVLFNYDATALEILLKARPALLIQDCRRVQSMRRKRPFKTLYHRNAKSTLLEEIRAYTGPLTWELLDLVIDYGADVNNRANTQHGLLECPPYYSHEYTPDFYARHAEMINYFIAHGLMDFRNNAVGSAVLSILGYFFDRFNFDIYYYAAPQVGLIIQRFELLGYQYNGTAKCIQAEEEQLAKWKTEVPRNHLGNIIYGVVINRVQLLTQHLDRIKNSPLTLKACARNEIRKALGGKDFCKKLVKLALPAHLKDFVRVVFPSFSHL